MARLIGTGKDPTGSIAAGQVVDADIADDEAGEHAAVERGFAEPLPDGRTPGARPIDVAHALVRGEDVSANPMAAEVAKMFRGHGDDPESGPDPHEAVHAGYVEPAGAAGKSRRLGCRR